LYIDKCSSNQTYIIYVYIKAITIKYISRTLIGVRDPMCENKKNEAKRPGDCCRRSYDEKIVYTHDFQKTQTIGMRIRKERVGQKLWKSLEIPRKVCT
jgi:hypothetical protein